MRPYTRIGPYLIGIALAYGLHKKKQNGCEKDSWVSFYFMNAFNF